MTFSLNHLDSIDNTFIPPSKGLGSEYATMVVDSFRQISALKYVEVEVKQSRKQGKHIPPTHAWFGRVISQGGQYLVPLDSTWVVENFDAATLDQVKQRYHSTTTKGMVPVPPGAPRTDLPHFMKQDAPVVMYQQKDNERLCFILSFCSALHYLGATDIAEKIVERGRQLENQIHQQQKFEQLVREKAKWLESTGLDKDHNLFDPRCWSPYPKAVQLQAHDGGVEHAIMVCGDYVFDSTCPGALPLSRETLDWCSQGQYLCIEFGYHFGEGAKKKGRNMRFSKLRDE